MTVPSTGSKATVVQFQRKFVKEANNLAGLSHPNIVKVIDVFKENGTDYYVMEFLGGGSLKDLVKKNGKIDESQALHYISQVGDALDYMHSQKYMCHYDVKPGNIMLDNSGTPKLIDFGISKNYDTEGNQTSSTPVGISKGFAPLEQYQQSVQELSPQTDVYALGATLYYLLTGSVPPEASLVFNNGLPALPTSISEKTRIAIESAMQPRKKDRPQSMREFLDLLQETVVEEDDKTFIDNPQPKLSPASVPEPVPQPKPAPLPKQNSDTKFIIANKSFIAIAIFVVLAIGFIIYWGSSVGNNSHIQEEIGEIAFDSIVIKEYRSNIFFHSGIGDCSYTGEVDDEGIPDGTGTATYSDGRVYEGNFEHGVMSGDANFKYGNGDTFEGTFSNNVFKEGKYTIIDDGSYFQGTFKNGKPDKGDWYDKSGKKI